MASKGNMFGVGEVMEALYSILVERKQTMKDGSYTSLLYKKGEDSILKKIGEEAGELIIASKGGDREKIIHEIVDLWFHCMVLMGFKGLTFDEIADEFMRRMGTSGLEEKASRKKE